MSSGLSALASARNELPTQIDEGARVLVVDDSPTILKVVSAILDRHGYTVVSARDGLEALEHMRGGAPFDLVLLDFVMPRMNGYQFCRELRADPELAQVPVVLMSARTAVIGEKFVEQTGAADALSKPFDARALVAVVGGVLSKGKLGDTMRKKLPEPDEMIDESELDSVESAVPPSRHVRAISRFATEVAAAVAPHLRGLRAADLQQPQQVEDAVLAGLSDDATLAQLARTLDDLELPNASNAILRGDIEQLPLVEVLQLFQLRRQNGVLKVTSGKKAVAMALREGHVDMVFARGCGDEFRLGRYLTRLGLVTREKMEAEVDACAGKMVIGQWLATNQLVDPAALDQALALQTAELTYETIRWNKGRFTLLDEPFWPEAEQAKLGLGLAELVLEGFRRVDEWRLMADTIDFDAVLVIDQVALDAVARKIGPTERRVLDAIDGARTVSEITGATDLASFDVLKILYRFLEARIARSK